MVTIIVLSIHLSNHLNLTNFLGLFLTLIYLLIFWKTHGKENPVGIPALLASGILLIFVIPLFFLSIIWFFVFCYQQASQDFMHHCFDQINRHYWASIRLGTTEPLIIFLLLSPLFLVLLYLFYLLYKEFKNNQHYFESKLDTEEQLKPNEPEKKKPQEEHPLMPESNEEQKSPTPAPLVAKQVHDKQRSRSPSRSRSSSRSNSKKKYQPIENPPVNPKPKSPSPKRNVYESPEPSIQKSPEPVRQKSPEPVYKKAPEPPRQNSPEPIRQKSPEAYVRPPSEPSEKIRKESERSLNSQSVDPNVGLLALGAMPSNRSKDKPKRKQRKKRRRQILNEKEDDNLPITYRKPRAVEPEPAKRKPENTEGFDFTEYYNNILEDDNKDQTKNKFTDKVKKEGKKHEISKFMSKLKPRGKKDPGLKKKPTFMNDIFNIVGNNGQSRFHKRK